MDARLRFTLTGLAEIRGAAGRIVRRDDLLNQAHHRILISRIRALMGGS